MGLDKIIVVVFVLLAVAGLIYLQMHSRQKEDETTSEDDKIESKK